MKRHKIRQIVRKPDGNFVVVFHDEMRVDWPCKYLQNIRVGGVVYEHKHKDGQTVAFSWPGHIRFMVHQPIYYDESLDFVKKFKPLDQVKFNNAIVCSMCHLAGWLVIPNADKTAHNMVVLGLKTNMQKQR